MAVWLMYKNVHNLLEFVLFIYIYLTLWRLISVSRGFFIYKYCYRFCKRGAKHMLALKLQQYSDKYGF